MKAWEICKEENVGKKYVDSNCNEWKVYKIRLINGDYYDLQDWYEHDLSKQYYLSSILELDFEEIIDWSKVPVDTKILVSNFGTKQYKAYFAKYEDGKIYAWDSGRTSFTAGFENNMACWDYVKLYKEGEE